jgi:hypothetical protein
MYSTQNYWVPKHTLRNSLMEARPVRVPQQTAQCVCIIPCDCGRSCTGDSGRPLAVRFNFKKGLPEKSNYFNMPTGSVVVSSWMKQRIWKLIAAAAGRYRKYKESAHVECLTNSISKPSLDISSI